jgi:hypothetical protein
MVSRLGAYSVTARANTWHTFATVTTARDGRVTFTVNDDAGLLLEVVVSPETEPTRSIDIFKPRDRANDRGES